MTSEGLGEMFEGDSADTCAGKFPLTSMGCCRPGSEDPHRRELKFYIKERACINFKCQGSFDGFQISSTSPAPFLTSGYASTSSDQVLGNSQSNNSKVMATSNTRSCKRPVHVRHPSLPDNEDDYEELFSEVGDFIYSDFDQT